MLCNIKLYQTLKLCLSKPLGTQEKHWTNRMYFKGGQWFLFLKILILAQRSCVLHDHGVLIKAAIPQGAFIVHPQQINFET